VMARIELDLDFRLLPYGCYKPHAPALANLSRPQALSEP
jgi:hypothetical protein